MPLGHTWHAEFMFSNGSVGRASQLVPALCLVVPDVGPSPHNFFANAACRQTALPSFGFERSRALRERSIAETTEELVVVHPPGPPAPQHDSRLHVVRVQSGTSVCETFK